MNRYKGIAKRLSATSKDMEKPLVSVVIPVYNGERHIRDAIDSALKQTHERTEVIVVDDGSTDTTPEILASYGEAIRVIHQDNCGSYAARNAGIDAARGRFVSLLDADDMYLEDKVAQSIPPFLENENVILAHTDVKMYYEQFNRITTRETAPAQDSYYKSLLLGNFIATSSVTFDKERLGKTRFNADYTGCMDWDLWLRLAKDNAFKRIPAPLVIQRIHPKRMTDNYKIDELVALRLGVLQRAFAQDESLTEEDKNKALATMYRKMGMYAYENYQFPTARALFRKSRAYDPSSSVVWQYAKTFLPVSLTKKIRQRKIARQMETYERFDRT